MRTNVSNQQAINPYSAASPGKNWGLLLKYPGIQRVMPLAWSASMVSFP